MLREKMQAVMAEVNSEVAEREKLVEYIAIALLTKSNLFILGDTGQAKSYAINRFRSRITGARQFERLLSKQCDEEQLFGRLDLSSLIPGETALSILEGDPIYIELREATKEAQRRFAQTRTDADFMSLQEAASAVNRYCNVLGKIHANEPTIITTGKIPDSEIVFLDEVFKANDGILNALLTALNERRYTNEGRTVDIPVVSFFAASNEIPNFSDPAEGILRPLYDRFQLKVVTDYVQDREKRLELLAAKQAANGQTAPAAFISLEELCEMQREVAAVAVPPAINELMDDVVCDLRRKKIHVSDRKFFNYTPFVQAKAWLDGRDTVQPFDLLCLEAYLWTNPEELPEIRQTLGKKCVNPLQDKADAIRISGLEVFEAFCQDKQTSGSKALVKFRGEIVAVYRQAKSLESELDSANDQAIYNSLIYDLGEYSRQAHIAVNFTVVPLDELAMMEGVV